MSLMGGKVSASNRGRWLTHEELRETFASAVCSRVNMWGAIWNCSCFGWKSGYEHEARGSGVIPTKTSAKSDSLEASDERALAADLLSCPAARSRGLFKRAFRNPGSATPNMRSVVGIDFKPKRGVFERVPLEYFCSCRSEIANVKDWARTLSGWLTLISDEEVGKRESVCSTTAVGWFLFTHGLGGRGEGTGDITDDVISRLATSVDVAPGCSLTANIYI